MHRHLRSTGLSELASDTLSETLPSYSPVRPLPTFFKGCDNLEEIKPTGIEDGYADFEERGDSALYCKDGLYAFPPKPREFFSTHSDIMAGCFAYCNIKTLKYNVRYIPNNTFLGFKGKIVFTQRLNYGDNIFEPLSQLDEESEVDVAIWGDYDRASKYYTGKITVNGGETLRVVQVESAFRTLSFDLKLFGTTKQSDVRSVTVGDRSMTLNADGRYTVDNLESGTKYEVRVTYIGEDGTLREQTETLSTKTARSTLTAEFRESTFVSISFDIHVSNPTTFADIQKVTILSGSAPFEEIADVPLTPDGKYVVNNLAPSTSYGVLVEYKGEDGNVRVDDFGYKTRDVGSLKAEDVSRNYWIAGAEMRIKDTAGGDKLDDLSQSDATYGIELRRVGNENGQTVYNETYESIEVSDDGYCFIMGLKPGQKYETRAFIKHNDKYYWGQKGTTHTNKPELYCYHKRYPTAIEFFESKSESDKTYEAKRVFCYENEKCTIPLRERIVWLDPGESFPVWLKIDDPDLADYVVKKFVYAADVDFSLKAENVTATTAHMNFRYKKAEKYEPELRFEFLGKPIEESGPVTGLVPNQQYITKYKAINVETGKEFQSKEIRFTTKPLTLETEAPKIPSAGNMIARATTNISELEPNVGFQWKKYDAPESLKPSEGFAVAYGGVLEGTIHNLQIDHYYNVRAFYRDMNGKEYYGKWITVDPSDFSWFEPNVHTYDVDRVTTNGAKARGYVVQGTDDIEKQGFEYWPSGDTSKRRVAYGAYAPADNGRQTILATGQLMTAELADLLSDTEYTVRSFVTTSASTYYGEEITFRTLEASGIEGVDVDDVEIVPVAYYRLDGTRGERPFTGLNMVLFSDGHVEKIVFK